MGEATQVLRHEHNTILYVLKILGRVVQTNAAETSAATNDCKELVHFLGLYVNDSHLKKEAALFAALKASGAQIEPMGPIMAGHAQAGDLIVRLSRALDAGDVSEFNGAATQYIRVLEGCIQEENGALFQLADQHLSEDQQDTLLEDFIEIEKAVIGRDLYMNMHDMITKWSFVFGV